MTRFCVSFDVCFRLLSLSNIQPWLFKVLLAKAVRFEGPVVSDKWICWRDFFSDPKTPFLPFLNRFLFCHSSFPPHFASRNYRHTSSMKQIYNNSIWLKLLNNNWPNGRNVNCQCFTCILSTICEDQQLLTLSQFYSSVLWMDGWRNLVFLFLISYSVRLMC